MICDKLVEWTTTPPPPPPFELIQIKYLIVC